MQRNIRIAKRWDTLARWIITCGGIMVVAAIIGIFFEIAAVTLPLFQAGDRERLATIQPPDEYEIVAAGIDNFRQTGFALSRAGSVFEIDIASRKSQFNQVLSSPTGASDATIVQANRVDVDRLDLRWSDGGLAHYQSRFQAKFDSAGNRTIDHQMEALVEVTRFAEATSTITYSYIQLNDDGKAVVAMIADSQILVDVVLEETNFLGQVNRETWQLELSGALDLDWTHVLVDQAGKMIYAAAGPHLLRWDISDPDNVQLLDRVDTGQTITALSFLLGDYSVAVGALDGQVSVWFPVREVPTASVKVLKKIHQLKSHDAGIHSLIAAPHNKSIVSIDESGTLNLDHATSERHLTEVHHPDGIRLAGFNERGESLLVVNNRNEIELFALHIPHPEVSFGTLFGKVWYEGYDHPQYVWQSSSASNDFEPKLSLIPLIVGTLKATLYAMLFSIPLALLAAIYANQFLSRRMHQVIKPGVEMMAAFPSVVIGFLAAIWFAPVLEDQIISMFLVLLVAPLSIVAWLAIWVQVEKRVTGIRQKKGLEYGLLIPVLIVAVWASIGMAPGIEAAIFDGDFNQWLFDSVGVRYDQRNSIVIAVALAFAVTPIIFTMTDDALGNVPKSLSAASLAVGASRWQTVWKIVLPSASPGIFAAVMIGLGRAVGETMIVLMAAGNTPILDWSIFNGMRTLSANIAVEIPEAPHGGTLYRVLFLSALLLFGFTFMVNTVAETVRTRLREKFGRF